MIRPEFSGFRSSLQRALTKIRGGRLTPIRFGCSVAVGAFVGTLPAYGAHFPLCALFCIPLRLNLIVAYAAAQISIPPLAPFLLYGSYKVGRWALPVAMHPPHGGDSLAPVGWVLPSSANLLDLGLTVGFGSVLLGLVLGLVLGMLAFVLAWVVGRRRESREERADRRRRGQMVSRVVSRYADAPRRHRAYVSIKLRTDPVVRRLLDFAPQVTEGATVVDAGCGRGQFSWLLSEAAPIGSLIGFDLEEDKVACARGAARAAVPSRADGFAGPEDVRFSVGDLATAPLAPCDVLLLLDVLHYLPVTSQSDLLQRAAVAVRPGGHVLVRETGAGFGSVFAKRFEHWGRWLGVNRGRTLAFRGPDWLVREASSSGLRLLERSEDGALSNVLLVFQRQGAARGSEGAAASGRDAAPARLPACAIR